MIDAAEYTKLTVAAWIEMLERWTPDPQHLVAAWCSDCVGSDFSDDIPRCRELPHDVVHAVIGAHEAAIARAEELLIALRVADLQSDWQMRTTPEFFGDEGFDIEYLTELQAEFLARQRWEADNIATWRDDTRSEVHRVLRSEMARVAGPALDMVRTRIRDLIEVEIDSLDVFGLVGAASSDDRWLAPLLDSLIAEWIIWLPSGGWEIEPESIPQEARCELCTGTAAWIPDLEVPHGAGHPLRQALDELLDLAIDLANDVPREPPAASPNSGARLRESFTGLLAEMRTVIDRALALYVHDEVEIRLREASRWIPVGDRNSDVEEVIPMGKQQTPPSKPPSRPGPGQPNPLGKPH